MIFLSNLQVRKRRKRNSGRQNYKVVPRKDIFRSFQVSKKKNLIKIGLQSHQKTQIDDGVLIFLHISLIPSSSTSFNSCFFSIFLNIYIELLFIIILYSQILFSSNILSIISSLLFRIHNIVKCDSDGAWEGRTLKDLVDNKIKDSLNIILFVMHFQQYCQQLLNWG